MAETMELRDRLIDEGYPVARADALALAQSLLANGARMISLMPPEDDDTGFVQVLVGAARSYGEILQHDDVLLPYWSKLAWALSSTAACERGYIKVAVLSVQISHKVSDILLHPLKEAPLKELLLAENDLDSGSLEFLAEVVETNPTLESVDLRDNFLGADGSSAIVNAASKNPNITTIVLDRCGIGRHTLATGGLSLSPNGFKELSLCGNEIGSHEAKAISKFIANNPGTEVLRLEDNLLTDDDAVMIAMSLATNTNLSILSLKGNPFTEVGSRALFVAICNPSSIGAINDSNHTCLLDVGSDDPYFGVEDNHRMNRFVDSKANRNSKIIAALRTNAYLDDAPSVIMPNVIAFLLEACEANEWTESDTLDVLHNFVMEWSPRFISASSE